MATGFHGFHVMIGTIFLAVCLLRAYWGHFTPEQHLGFEFAAWYWHFVDVVWLFLFAAIYVWGSGAPAAATVLSQTSPYAGRPRGRPFRLEARGPEPEANVAAASAGPTGSRAAAPAAGRAPVQGY